MNDGFSASGTITLKFTGTSPPQGSRLNAFIRTGNVTCPREPPPTATTAAYYVHPDQLDTSRSITNGAGTVTIDAER